MGNCRILFEIIESYSKKNDSIDLLKDGITFLDETNSIIPDKSFGRSSIHFVQSNFWH
jgi:hypothetical protein